MDLCVISLFFSPSCYEVPFSSYNLSFFFFSHLLTEIFNDCREKIDNRLFIRSIETVARLVRLEFSYRDFIAEFILGENIPICPAIVM